MTQTPKGSNVTSGTDSTRLVLGRGSFTIFVLPFAYQPRLLEEPLPGPRFVRDDPPGLFRRYFTPETGASLYQRALWMRFQDSVDLLTHPEQPPLVMLDPPRLVLMEWSAARTDDVDLLRVGFLLITARFPGGPISSLADLQRFNELFRYWHQPEPYNKEKRAALLAGIRDALGQGEDPAQPGWGRWARWLRLPLLVGDRAYDLMPSTWHSQAEGWLRGSDKESPNQGWVCHADNRAFVFTAALLDGGCAALGDKPVTSGAWMRLLNVDEPSAAPASCFEQDWAAQRTYQRWAERGTLYGFTYFSGAMLGPSEQAVGAAGHFERNYFSMTLLLLYLRVGLMRFSERLASISAQARQGGDHEQWRKQFEALRWSFTLFSNLYQFPLLSNQQQGIELYELLRGQLDVEQFFKEVERDINNSHDYLEQREEHEQTRAAQLLNWVATVGLGVGAATGFLGMNIFVVKALQRGGEPPKTDGLCKELGFVFVIILAFVALFILPVLVYRRRSRSR